MRYEVTKAELKRGTVYRIYNHLRLAPKLIMESKNEQAVRTVAWELEEAYRRGADDLRGKLRGLLHIGERS